VEEVREDVVLDDAYAGDSCAFMLQYVLRDSDSYRICLETDKLHTHATHTTPSITNVSSALDIIGTSQSQDVKTMPAFKSTEDTDEIAIVPPIAKEEGDQNEDTEVVDQNKETAQSNSDNADINSNLETLSNVEEEIDINSEANKESHQLKKDTQQSNINKIVAIPSAPSPNEALAPFPLSKQFHSSATALTDFAVTHT
jgi:hypothetical protein